MTLEELQQLVQAGESETVEFKATTGQIKAAFETLCAFLNHKGGIVIIGANEKGRVLGQDVSDTTQQEIAREMAKFEPHPLIDIQYIPITDSKKVILLQVFKGEQIPYSYDGRAWQRDQSVTRRMSLQRRDLLARHRHHSNITWEQLFAPKYTFVDLDRDLIIGLVHKAVEAKRMPASALRQDLPQLLESLQLLEEGKLRNAAVVLFGRRMTNHFLQCRLKLARFKGVTRHEFLDSEMIASNLFEMLEKGELFIKRHLPVAAKIIPGQFERVETPLIPYRAIREALINALCHRDYSVYGGSIALAIYDDRMELSNDGSLPPNITLEKIKAGFSKPRNPLIAEVLHRCNLIERWGRGIQEIIQACKAADDPEPEFVVDEAEFKIIFKFPDPSLFFQQDFSLSHFFPNLWHLPNYQREAILGLTLRQRDILTILRNAKVHNVPSNGELTIREILKQLQNSLPIRTLRHDLAKLRKIGIVGSSGRAQSAKWFFKMEFSNFLKTNRKAKSKAK